MISDRLSDALFTKEQSERLASLLNGAGLFHAHWRAADLMRTTPRRLVGMYERDSRAGSLRALIEAVIDE